VTRVEVEIQELVLHGFERLDGRAVAASLERALAARLAAEGGVGAARSVDRIEAAAVRLHANASPRTVGRAVAASLHRSVLS
jgi:hypothetical protein